MALSIKLGHPVVPLMDFLPILAVPMPTARLLSVAFGPMLS
jgi:hypothetical protein